MKKLLSAALTVAVCLAFLAPAAAGVAQERLTAKATNNAIVVSNSADVPDAHMVYPAVYKIEGDNYFRLRDLAMLLRGSDRQFAVDYDAATKSVSIVTGRPYAPIGGELSGVVCCKGGFG